MTGEDPESATQQKVARSFGENVDKFVNAVSEQEERRYRLARSVLMVIAACFVAVSSAYWYSSGGRATEDDLRFGMAKDLFEFVKVGLLPLAAGIIAYYFQTSE